MADMIERVAKAMAESAGFCWENCAQSQWRRDARAGIEAMREPTAEMIKAFHAETESGAFNGHSMWDAMIGAALTGNREGETG